MASDVLGIAVLCVAGLSAFIVYMIPAMLGFAFDHRDKFAIATLNLLLGWTFLGWVVALVWSMTNPPKR